MIRLWPVNVAFWSSPIQPAFTTGLWKGTIHEFTAITTHIINMPIVVSATPPFLDEAVETAKQRAHPGH